jgi:hypothetical protein
MPDPIEDKDELSSSTPAGEVEVKAAPQKTKPEDAISPNSPSSAVSPPPSKIEQESKYEDSQPTVASTPAGEVQAKAAAPKKTTLELDAERKARKEEFIKAILPFEKKSMESRAQFERENGIKPNSYYEAREREANMLYHDDERGKRYQREADSLAGERRKQFDRQNKLDDIAAASLNQAPSKAKPDRIDSPGIASQQAQTSSPENPPFGQPLPVPNDNKTFVINSNPPAKAGLTLAQILGKFDEMAKDEKGEYKKGFSCTDGYMYPPGLSVKVLTFDSPESAQKFLDKMRENNVPVIMPGQAMQFYPPQPQFMMPPVPPAPPMQNIAPSQNTPNQQPHVPQSSPLTNAAEPTNASAATAAVPATASNPSSLQDHHIGISSRSPERSPEEEKRLNFQWKEDEARQVELEAERQRWAEDPFGEPFGLSPTFHPDPSQFTAPDDNRSVAERREDKAAADEISPLENQEPLNQESKYGDEGDEAENDVYFVLHEEPEAPESEKPLTIPVADVSPQTPPPKPVDQPEQSTTPTLSRNSSSD